MSTIIQVFLHAYKSTFRNIKSSGIMFALPIVFMAIFGFAFGGSTNYDISVGVLQDGGGEFDFSEILEDISSDTDSLNFEVSSYSEIDELENDLDGGVTEIGVVIDADGLQNPMDFNYEVLIPDGSVGSQIDQAIIADIITSIKFGEDAKVQVSTINPDYDGLTGFDYLAPGLIVYGLIVLIPGLANDFTNIAEKKQIFRYSTSRVRSIEIIAGYTLFYMLIGVIQSIILYLTALALGYQAVGDVWNVVLPALLVSLFVVAVGLVIGSFFDKTEAGTNVGTIVSILLGFFSGSFISGVGNILQVELFGYEFSLNQILPTTWGTEAFEQILTRGRGLDEVTTELLVLLISGLITLAIGVWIYSKRQLNLQR